MAGVNNKKTFNIRLYLLVTLLIVLIGIVAAALFSTFLNPFSASRTGTVHFLIAGTDKGGLRTDSIMVAAYDPKAKKLTIMSILRDTRVYVKGRFRKINAAFALGKKDLLLKTLKETFGMDIDYYITIQNTAFDDAINTLGGVDINVPYDMNYDDPYQDLHIHLKKGYQHLNGKQAEEFVRWRKNNTGPSIGDIERVKNQQQFMKNVFDQKMNLSLIWKANDIYKIINKDVDTNLSFKDCMALFSKLKQMKANHSITTIDIPGKAKMIHGASYYIYNAKETEDILRNQMGMEEANVIASGHKPNGFSSDDDN